MTEPQIFVLGKDPRPDWFWDLISANLVITHDGDMACIHAADGIICAHKGSVITRQPDGSLSIVKPPEPTGPRPLQAAREYRALK